MEKTINQFLFTLAVVAALKKAQELTYQYCGSLVKGEKLWYEVPFFQPIPKAWVKSMWRHYVSNNSN